MEVPVHPPGGGPVRRRGPAVSVPFQQRPALHEAVHGEFVERVAGAVPGALPARHGQQFVDQREGVGGGGLP
ncbi:hypothetical protein SMICM304S_12230 [Streptomyces microflavus]